MMRRVLALVVAGGAIGAWLWLRGGEEADGSTVPTYVVIPMPLPRAVVAEGNLRAVKATPLVAPKSGAFGPKKIAWLAPDGSRVKQGEIVVRFDRTESEKQLADGQSDLASADARRAGESIKTDAAIRARDRAAALAASELEQRRKFQSKDAEIFSRNERIESEIDEQLASAQQRHAEGAKAIERAVSRSKTGVIGVEQQKARLAIDHANSALDGTELRAPHDGVFVLQRDWRNQVARVGDSKWPGQPIAEIPLLDAMEASVFVLEVDGGELAVKQPVALTIEAHPEVVHRGTVRIVDKLAKPRTDGTPIQYFEVTVALDRTDVATMKPGQRVRARITQDTGTTPVLAIPRQAIMAKDGKNHVWRRGAAGEFESVVVELGPTTSGRVTVTRGLASGDVIALRDPTRSMDQTLGTGDGAEPKRGGGAE
jgi:HlyD family secretion protein